MKNKFRQGITKLVSLSDQLLLSINSFLCTILLANVLPREVFYVYSLLYAYLIIVNTITQSVIGQYVVLNGHKFAYGSFVKMVGMVLLTLLLFNFINLNIPFWGLSQHSLREKILVNLFITLYCCFDIKRRYFYSNKTFYKSFLLVLSYFVPSIILILFFKTLHLQLFTYLGICCAVLFVLLLVKLPVPDEANKKAIDYTHFYHFSKWLFGGIILYIIATRLFVFLIGKDKTDEVAVFRLIDTLFGFSMVILASLENYFLVNLRRQDERYTFKTVFRYTIRYICFIILFLLLIASVKGLLLQYIFHNKYQIDSGVMFLGAISYSIFTLSRIFVVYYRLLNFTKPIFWGNFCNAFIVTMAILFAGNFSITQVFCIFIFVNLCSLLTYTFFYLKKNKPAYIWVKK